jgi:hypothetical protein
MPKSFPAAADDPVWAACQMLGVMLYPAEPDRASEYAAVTLLREISLAEGRDDATAVERLSARMTQVHGYSLACRAIDGPRDATTAETRGRTAGQVLGWLLAFDSTRSRREHATIRRAADQIAKARAEKPQTIRGVSAPSSRTSITNAWTSHQEVAHLWLARWRAEAIDGLSPDFATIGGLAGSILDIARRHNGVLRDLPSRAMHPDPAAPRLPWEPPTVKHRGLIRALRDDRSQT